MCVCTDSHVGKNNSLNSLSWKLKLILLTVLISYWWVIDQPDQVLTDWSMNSELCCFLFPSALFEETDSLRTGSSFGAWRSSDCLTSCQNGCLINNPQTVSSPASWLVVQYDASCVTRQTPPPTEGQACHCDALRGLKVRSGASHQLINVSVVSVELLTADTGNPPSWLIIWLIDWLTDWLIKYQTLLKNLNVTEQKVKQQNKEQINKILSIIPQIYK